MVVVKLPGPEFGKEMEEGDGFLTDAREGKLHWPLTPDGNHDPDGDLVQGGPMFSPLSSTGR